MRLRASAVERSGARGLAAACLRLVACACLVVVPVVDARHEYSTREQALASAFPGRTRIESVTVRFDAAARSDLEGSLRRRPVPRELTFFDVRDERGEPLGWAIERDVLGKSEPITYLVAFDAQRRVLGIEILAYRESHGGEVRRGAFRKQFVGKDARSELKLGRDVRNISGATISCRAITDGVHDDARLLERALSSQTVAANTSALDADRPAVLEEQPGNFRRAQVCMGTLLEIVVADVPAEVAQRASTAAFAEADRLDRLLSHYRETSDVSRLGQAAGLAPVEIAPETLEILRASQRLSRATDGAFDPCLGALARLWSNAARDQRWPSAEELATARAGSGLAHLQLDDDRRTGFLDRAGTRIDLGGIGKGFALDRLGQVLESHGVTSALLSFGGQILALDAPRSTPGWRVDVAAPNDRSRAVASLTIARLSVATSSDSERSLRIGARRVSHVLDPRTGEPTSATASSTVCARNATEADAWSTATFVLGEAGPTQAEKHGIAALWIAPDGRRVTNRPFAELAPSQPDSNGPER